MRLTRKADSSWWLRFFSFSSALVSSAIVTRPSPSWHVASRGCRQENVSRLQTGSKQQEWRSARRQRVARGPIPVSGAARSRIPAPRCLRWARQRPGTRALQALQAVHLSVYGTAQVLDWYICTHLVMLVEHRFEVEHLGLAVRCVGVGNEVGREFRKGQGTKERDLAVLDLLPLDPAAVLVHYDLACYSRRGQHTGPTTPVRAGGCRGCYYSRVLCPIAYTLLCMQTVLLRWALHLRSVSRAVSLIRPKGPTSYPQLRFDRLNNMAVRGSAYHLFTSATETKCLCVSRARKLPLFAK